LSAAGQAGTCAAAFHRGVSTKKLNSPASAAAIDTPPLSL
jgi:hypothetical protein